MKTFRIHSFLAVSAVVTVILAIPSCSSRSRLATQDRISRFEKSIERLQRDLKIPGMAAVILEGQQIRWTKGFGYADVENGVAATPHTPFQLCSVTKPVAAMIIHRLVEQGRLDLQTPLTDSGIDLDTEGTVRLIHLITHTSQGIPGTQYRYHGDRYGMLGTAVKRETGKSFRTLLIEEVLEPFEMSDSAPNPADPELLERFFEYLRVNGLDQGIKDTDGKLWASGDLFDYDDPLYEPSIYLSVAMLADYFDFVGIKKGRFLRYVDKTTGEQTKRDFAEFYASTNEYLDIYERLATPYGRDSEGNMVPDKYSMFFNCAAGLNASVLDMAKFDMALDTNYFVSPPTRDNAYRAFVTSDGDTTPYGLGWFTEEYKGIRLIWHGGEWRCASALYLKIPDRDLTLIIEANSRLLSQAFAMGLGSVLESGFGLEFLRIFVYESALGELGPDIDWAAPLDAVPGKLAAISNQDLFDIYKKQMHVMSRMYMMMGRKEVTSRIFEEIHTKLMPQSLVGKYDDITPIAAIEKVSDSEDLKVDFTLAENTIVRVYALGEISEDDSWDYGWIEDRSTGRVVWRMSRDQTSEAGGADRNRLSDIAVNLPAGDYTLRYKSDDAHSFMSWYSTPPKHLYWGIRLHVEHDDI